MVLSMEILLKSSRDDFPSLRVETFQPSALTLYAISITSVQRDATDEFLNLKKKGFQKSQTHSKLENVTAKKLICHLIHIYNAFHTSSAPLPN
jgi:hypothetical protein